MKTFSFYDPATGNVYPRKLQCFARVSEAFVAANTPDGAIAIEGDFDPLSQRIDLETGQAVEFQPPRPEGYTWDADLKRWTKPQSMQDAESRRLNALARIEDLEKRQARPVRELAVDPTNDEARRRVNEIEQQISQLRASL